MGISTLDILVAAQPSDPRPLFALFGAGRRRVGYARFAWSEGAWQQESEVQLVEWRAFPEEVDEPALVVGEFSAEARKEWEAHADHLTLPAPAHHLRRAGFLADLAWARVRAGETEDPARLTPIYIR